MNLLDNADNPESILQGNPQLSLDSSPSLSTEQDKQKLASLLQFIRTSQAAQIQPPVAPQPGSGVSPSGNTIYGDSRPIDQQPGWNPLLGRGTPGGIYDPLSQFREHANLLQQKIESDKTSDNFKKIILAKFTSGQLKQDEQGNYLEIQQLPNELGQLERKWMPISLPTAEMLRHIGGPAGIGMADQKQVNAAVAARAAIKQPPPQGTTPVISPPSEDSTVGLLGALQNFSKARSQSDYASSLEPQTTVYPFQMAGNLLKNVGTSITGGRYAPLDQGTPTIRDDRGERQMIDVLRARKGLGPISDMMWQEFQANRGQGANRPILSQ